MSKEPPEYELPGIPGQPVPQTVPQSHDATVVSTQPGPSVTVRVANTKPKNYLARSLLTCLCCSCFFGIFALIMSLEVNSAWSRGDVAGAKWASFEAKRFNIYGLVCGSTFYGFIAVILLNILFWAN